MIRIKNPDILRKKVIAVESKMRKIMEETWHGYVWWQLPFKIEKVKELLEMRASYLNRMFLATTEEVKRLEDLNNLFLKKAEEMRKRSAILYETMKQMKKMPEFDDLYEIEAIMRVQGNTSDEECIIKLPEDEYYGSDFLLSAEALNFTMSANWNHSNCFYCVEAPNLNTEKDNPGTSFTDTMEDGLSWAEGALYNDALKHICICYPIHDICCHNPYSIPDLIRINDVKIEVKLSIEHHMTQHGIRSFEPGYRSWR